MTSRLPTWAWIAALVGGLVVGALLHLPVRVALRWAAPTGTMQGITVDGRLLHWEARHPDGWQVAFEASAWPLLLGRYAGTLEASRGAAHLRGHAVRAWNGEVTLSDGEGGADVAPLTLALSLPPSLIDGTLVLRDVALRWQAGALTELSCAGEVTGVRAGGGADAIAIGELGVSCSTAAGGPLIVVEDHGGPLSFRSEVRFGSDGRFMVSGTAGARPGAPPALAAALPLLGRSVGPDQISFNYSGALPGATAR